MHPMLAGAAVTLPSVNVCDKFPMPAVAGMPGETMLSGDANPI
jgi:hypothetical protein